MEKTQTQYIEKRWVVNGTTPISESSADYESLIRLDGYTLSQYGAWSGCLVSVQETRVTETRTPRTDSIYECWEVEHTIEVLSTRICRLVQDDDGVWSMYELGL